METGLGAHPTTEAAAQARAMSVGASSDPPTIGVLTRTMFRSPITKLILPARIRHRAKNDVVFVQEGSIEIKEYLHDVLEHVALKDDFGAVIRSAGVIGETGKSSENVEVKAEEDIEPARNEILRQSAPAAQPRKLPDSDSMETDDIPNLPEMPPQILVMTLQSPREDSLLFLCASQDTPDGPQFLSYQRPLPALKNESKRLGKHVAIDPRSRAMATSAQSGSFVVYALKPMSQLREEVERPEGLLKDNFLPITEERYMSVKGIIQKMEFLYPSIEDEDHVILLLVVTDEEKTRFLVYEWDCSKDLRTIGPPITHPVSKAQSCPLLVIPFIIITGFVLVCEDSISMIHDVLTGNFESEYVLIPQNIPQSPPREPGSSRRSPLWTAWARPLRRYNYSAKMDVFYLCREDGIVQFLEFELVDSRPRSATHGTGQFYMNVDTAFAALDQEWDRVEQLPEPARQWAPKMSSDDILIVGGDMSDGKLIQMVARMNAIPLQSIPNWTPMVDFCTATLSPGRTLVEGTRSLEVHPHSKERVRIFGCVGRGKYHGAVCEMRSGIEAHSLLRFGIDAGVTQLWILPDISSTNSGICMLMTYLDDTSGILRIQNDGDQDLSELENLFGIDIDSRTLAAGSTSSGVVVQVTGHSLRAFLPGHDVSVLRCFENERVTLACIRSEAILVTTIRAGEPCLQYGNLQLFGTRVSLDWAEEPFRMHAEPTCLSLQAINGVTYAFVGDTDGKLIVFGASATSGLTRKLTHTFEGEFAICESVALLRQESPTGLGGPYLLLCGLRNGSIQTFLFGAGQLGAVRMSICETLRFGKTKVSVIPDNTSWDPSPQLCSRAIMVCGENFCRLTFRFSGDGSYHASIQTIWLTADNGTGIHHTIPSVVAQADPWNIDHDGQSRLLFCADASNIHGTELSSGLRPHAVVRQMRIHGTPNKVIFSNYLQKLVVACTTIKARNVPQTNEHMRQSNKRQLYPTLIFIDPNENIVDGALDTKPELHDDHASEARMLSDRTPQIIGKSGMKILGLLEWKATIEGKSFLFLIVNSLRNRAEPGRVTGILSLYAITEGDHGQVALKSSGGIKYDQPVYSVAQYDECSLVHTTGKTLCLTTLRNVDGTPRLTSTMGWDRLGSLGVSVSARKPYIYVTTIKHSVSVFVIDRNTFKPLFTDETGARPGIHHLALPTHSMVLASDRNGVVAGLWQPPATQISNSFRTVFEAVLPGPMRKLHLAVVKVPWSAQTEEVGETIIGSGLDGSFHQFELIDEAKWRLLRFLQNMCERNRVICPHSHFKRNRQRLEPLAPTKRDMHIDGDILWRLIDRPDSGALLRAMLQEEPVQEPNRRTDEFDTSEERLARFLEVASDAALGGSTEGRDSVEAVVGFLRRTLRPIL